MTQPYVEYTGDGATVLFAIPFPYISQDDIRVELDGGALTDITFVNATTIQLTSPPGVGTTLAIFRDTGDSNLRSLFTPGATIRAQDLNNNFYQTLYRGQEAMFVALQATTGEIPAGGITSTMLADGSVGTTKLAAGAVTASKFGTGVVETAALAAQAVTQNKLGPGAVTSPKLANNLTLPGNPTTTTQGTSNNSARIATTAYVTDRVADLAPTKAGDGASGSWGIDITGGATKLTNTRTLWGRNFDGTANVTGNLTDVSNITGVGDLILSSGGSNTNLWLRSQGTGIVVLDPKANGGSQVQFRGGTYRLYNSDTTNYVALALPTLTASRTLTFADGTTTLVAGTMVANALTLTAGDGLTGGGNLTANRTFTMGTPGTLTTATTNSVSATSHTHAITASPAHAVASSSNVIGSYSMVQNKTTSIAAGATSAGSNLRFAKANSSGSFYSITTTGAGTWRNMGAVVATDEFGLFQRVS